MLFGLYIQGAALQHVSSMLSLTHKPKSFGQCDPRSIACACLYDVPGICKIEIIYNAGGVEALAKQTFGAPRNQRCGLQSSD